MLDSAVRPYYSLPMPATNTASTITATLTDIEGYYPLGRSVLDFASSAAADGWTICSYGSPVDDAREGLSPQEAASIATEDPALVYFTRPHVVIHNLTPHVVRVDASYPHTGTTAYPTEGLARLEQTTAMICKIGPHAVASPVYGTVTGLPEPREGHYYIVSMVVAQALAERLDLVWPDSGPDANRIDGQIHSVRRLLSRAPAIKRTVVRVDGREYEAFPAAPGLCVVRLVVPLTATELAAHEAECERVHACDRGERGPHLLPSDGPSPTVRDGSQVTQEFASAGLRLGGALARHGAPRWMGVLARVVA